jgi:hypothetical protein
MIEEAVKASIRRPNVNPSISRMIPEKPIAANSGHACLGLAPILRMQMRNYFMTQMITARSDESRADRKVRDDVSVAGL